MVNSSNNRLIVKLSNVSVIYSPPLPGCYASALDPIFFTDLQAFAINKKGSPHGGASGN